MPPQKQPKQLTPVLATPGKKPFSHPDWFHEIKWNGYRALSIVDKGKASIFIDGEDHTRKYKLIANELAGLTDCVLDGEIVVLDEEGKPDPEALHNYQGNGDIVYYVFDLLNLEGESYLNRPLIQRKEMLLHAISKVEIITYNDHFDNGVGLFESIKSIGLAGIVSKRKESIYRPGELSKDWLYIDTNTVKPVKQPKKIPDLNEALRREIEMIRKNRPR